MFYRDVALAMGGYNDGTPGLGRHREGNREGDESWDRGIGLTATGEGQSAPAPAPGRHQIEHPPSGISYSSARTMPSRPRTKSGP